MDRGVFPPPAAYLGRLTRAWRSSDLVKFVEHLPGPGEELPQLWPPRSAEQKAPNPFKDCQSQGRRPGGKVVTNALGYRRHVLPVKLRRPTRRDPPAPSSDDKAPAK